MMRRIRRTTILAGALTVAAFVAAAVDSGAASPPPAPAAMTAVGSEGTPAAAVNRRGRVRLRIGTCKYGVQGPVGFLQTVIWPPKVASPNLRPGVVDGTWARYRAVLVDANTGARLARSGWSGWLWTVDNRLRTWTGTTVFPKWDWKGNYVVKVKVEWWNSQRKLGQAWRTLRRYGYLNEYNVGPFGPMSSCFKANTAGWVIIEVPVPPWP
jgi:hypothetical protein